MARVQSDAATGHAHYLRLKQAVAGHALPLAVLDLDALEANARSMLVRAGQLPVRLCSKSVRCVEVLRHVMRMSPRFQGLLCYSAREAAWLTQQGFDDLLIAYPTVEPADLDAAAQALKSGHTITLMVDHAEQLPIIAARARQHGVVFRLAIDLDLSSDFGGLYFGVRRSPIKSPALAVSLARRIAEQADALRLVGLMGYEAQVAGLPDALPGDALRSAVVRGLKALSRRELTRRRIATRRALTEAGFPLLLVNGGGTGSLDSTSMDAAVSEVSAGSGLYAPCLFDHFENFRNTPALHFALPVTRRPTANIVTCAFGGYAASGPGGADRSPQPALPPGLKLLPHEGAGEVQTPIELPPGLQVALGDPLFFRHAKAGELAERFTRFLFVRGASVVADVATYRGDGQCFF